MNCVALGGCEAGGEGEIELTSPVKGCRFSIARVTDRSRWLLVAQALNRSKQPNTATNAVSNAPPPPPPPTRNPGVSSSPQLSRKLEPSVRLRLKYM